MSKPATVETTFDKLNGVPLAELTAPTVLNEDGTQKYPKVVSELPLVYSYDKLETGDVVPDKEKPDEKGIISFANGRRNSAARAKAQAAAAKAAGIDAPTIATSPAKRLSDMVKIIMATGVSEDVAEQRAKMALGL